MPETLSISEAKFGKSAIFVAAVEGAIHTYG